MFNCIELFAGAGGLSLALEKANFKILALLEKEKNCCNTLRLNFPNIKVIENDILNVDLSEYVGQVDLLAGGIPCQPFSFSGLRKGLSDKRGQLFFEFIKNVNILKPKVFLIENVKGLYFHDNKKTFEFLNEELQKCGYKTYHKILNAVDYDVPQYRERLIIVGVRTDIEKEFVFPKKTDKKITIREALKDVPVSEGVEYQEYKKNILSLVPEGGNWKNLPIEKQKEYLGKSFYSAGGKTGVARRLSWDAPSPTLLCSPSQKITERCHPKETRPLTVREYARLQTFPDDYEFTGGITSKYSQIGNAVPVNLGYAVTNEIYKFLKNI